MYKKTYKTVLFLSMIIMLYTKKYAEKQDRHTFVIYLIFYSYRNYFLRATAAFAFAVIASGVRP